MIESNQLSEERGHSLKDSESVHSIELAQEEVDSFEKEVNHTRISKFFAVVQKYMKFVGPGLMVSVAYMDPGNYATSISGGASNQFSLLFIILLSCIIAIFLQVLCIKLGSITGADLSKNCYRNLPRWLNYIMWILAECAIIATDVAEVIGTAIALNILIKIPLPAGVVMTSVDVFFVLMAYRPGASLKFVRIFEYCVALLVFIVVICFCIELSYIPHQNVGKVFRGFVPSAQMLENGGVYTSASILGATVMPHSLFLGSGLVQPRLREFDIKSGHIKLSDDPLENEESYYRYRPSMGAINYALKYSIMELVITLFTFAIFVNAAILVIAGSTLYGTEAAINADLYTIYHLLKKTIAPAVATIFMVLLLCSGQSAGIVCTIAGQIVSEGHLNWTCKPWIRRIITRSISIIPCLIITLCIGKNGLDKLLNASQFVLSIMLPFLSAPLIYFTCNKKIMEVKLEEENCKDMSNNWITTIVAVLVWIFISILNVYAIVQAARTSVV